MIWKCRQIFVEFSFHLQLFASINRRETFPVSYSRLKSLEVHCDHDQSIRHSAVSKSDSSSWLPELSFNRLQLSESEYCGLQRRNFGRFIAREAVLDEEYWVCLAFPSELWFINGTFNLSLAYISESTIVLVLSSVSHLS